MDSHRDHESVPEHHDDQDAPAHDSRNCRLCDWYHHAQAPGLPQIELIVIDGLPSQIVVLSECRVEQLVVAELSRGPPSV